ncbi:MAG: fatty acid desaturase, partial [Pseudomonadota bacterium]|nr:fatty acid desaturase [Pseudomonadota bacterium]
MDLRAHTRAFCDKDNRLAALSYFGTFAVYFAALYLAIAYVDRWYVMVPAGVVFAFAAVRLYV